MLPPSNSFLHQTLKFAELSTNMQSQENLTPPPPPYSQTPGQTPQNDIYSDSDAEDEETPWDTEGRNQVTINIDASINVHGNSNTVILASDRTSPEQPNNESSESTMTALQTTQKHRQTKLTEMATAIIAALHESRTYSIGDEEMFPAPIEININTGVKVKGSKNVICAGGSNGAGRLLHKMGAAGTRSEITENRSRKRRAQSVSVLFTCRIFELMFDGP